MTSASIARGTLCILLALTACGGGGGTQGQPGTPASPGKRSDIYRSALVSLSNTEVEHRVLNASKHEMILPGALRYVAQRRPWSDRNQGLERSIQRSLATLCGDTYPAFTHIGRDGNQAVLVGMSTCTGNTPEPVAALTAARTALDDASYSIKQEQGSFSYTDAAIRRLEADQTVIEQAVGVATVRQRHGLSPDDDITTNLDGGYAVLRADGRKQRITADGTLMDIPDKPPARVAGGASAAGGQGPTPGSDVECGYTDIEGTRGPYTDYSQALRVSGLEDPELLRSFDEALAAAPIELDAKRTKLGKTTEEFVTLATEQVTQLSTVHTASLAAADSFGGRDTPPDCTSGASATGASMCAAAVSYISAVQVAMYCQAAAT